MKHPQTVCFVAGRSGGHILPGLTLADQYKQKGTTSIIFFSTNTHLDTTLLTTHKAIDRSIFLNLDNVPRKLWGYPLFLVRAIKALIDSLYYLHKLKPDVVISMGGYISLPVCLAAYVLRIPFDIFELNAIPGKATTFLAPYARTVYTCFANTAHHLPKAHCLMAAYPLRFTDLQRTRTQLEALQHIGFSANKKTVFILGGSQGSVFINTMIKDWIEYNPGIDSQLQIIHQTGAQDATDWHAFYKQHHIPTIIFAYHDAIDYYYRAADLIICRSGAGTLHEILFFGKRCITIPLETATTDHQIDNAQSMAQEHPELFTVVYQKDIQSSPQKAFALITEQLQLNLMSTTSGITNKFHTLN